MVAGSRVTVLAVAALLFALAAQQVLFDKDTEGAENVVGAVEQRVGTNAVGRDLPASRSPDFSTDFDQSESPGANLSAKRDLFAEPSWTSKVAPVRLEKVVPPVEIVAPKVIPPLPFTYVGKMLDGNSLVIFIGYDGKQVAVKAGDVIGGYRADAVEASRIDFVYLESGDHRTLEFGGAK